MPGTDPEQDKRNKSSLAPTDYGDSYGKYVDRRPAPAQAKYYDTQGRQAQDPYAVQQQAQQAPVQMEEPQRAGPTGFVGFSQQLAANRDVAARMAGDAGKAAMEGGGVGNLRNDAGRQALLQRAYGKAAQVTGMDAALAGAAGGDYFTQLQSAYGPEAMARTAADMAAGRQNAAATQARFNQAGAAQQQAQKQAEAAAKEQRVRDEVARLQRLSDSNTSRGTLRDVTPEQWAAMHGMTLEEWVRKGKQPAY